MKNKAQAAMEFIMTYGWAIIIVAAALGVISYLGFFRGGNIPEQTQFGAPLSNVDLASITTNEVAVSLRNDGADTLTILGGDVTRSRGGDPGCSYTSHTDSDTTESGIQPGDPVVITYTCTSLGDVGDRVDLVVSVQYKNEYSGLTRSHQGTVKGIVG